MQCFPLILFEYKEMWVGHLFRANTQNTDKKRLRFSKLSNVCIVPNAATTKNVQKTVLTRARFTTETFFHSPLAGAGCLASSICSTWIWSRRIWGDQIGWNMTKHDKTLYVSKCLQLSWQPTEIRCCRKRRLQLQDAKFWDKCEAPWEWDQAF